MPTFRCICACGPFVDALSGYSHGKREGGRAVWTVGVLSPLRYDEKHGSSWRLAFLYRSISQSIRKRVKTLMITEGSSCSKLHDTSRILGAQRLRTSERIPTATARNSQRGCAYGRRRSEVYRFEHGTVFFGNLR